MTNRPARSRHAAVGTVVGVAILFGGWALASLRYPEIILPSPAQTWSAGVDLASDGTLWRELGRTLGRSILGVALALAIGAFWGTLCGLSDWFAAVTRPMTSAMMALPPVVVVTLAMVWFGPGPAVTRLVVVIVALPMIVLAIEEAIHNLDDDLLEMARLFDVPRRLVLRHVLAPGITSPVAAVTAVTIGQAIRVTVMAELLAAADGIGAEIALARTNLATATLFAWAVAMVASVVIIETLVLRPVNARLSRWRDAPRAIAGHTSAGGGTAVELPGATRVGR